MATAQKKPNPENEYKARRNDADGLTMPTRLEIAEGAAWIELERWPEDSETRRRYAVAFNALSRAQNGSYGSLRCESCGVRATGRKGGDPCGNCKTLLVGWKERAA